MHRRAGDDQIAHAGKARKRFLAPAEAFGQPRGLRHRAGDQQRLGVVAEAETVAHAAAQRRHVLERAGQLHADHVVMRIDAEALIGKHALDKLRGLRAVRRGDHAGRHGARDLLRVRGAREHGNRMLPARLLRDDLRHTQMRAALDALCDREQRHAVRQVRRCLLRHRAQRERRRCEHDQLGVSQAIQVICDLQFNRKLHTGQ